MLKSTHQIISLPQLPMGWTEHKAPTGHLYYYNSATGQSTYTRPVPEPIQAPSVSIGVNQSFLQYGSIGFPSDIVYLPKNNRDFDSSQKFQGTGSRRAPTWLRDNKPRPHDKPKTRQKIPGHENWVLVQTKFHRRFVYNTEKNQSFWRIPDKLKSSILELDQQRIKQKAGVSNNLTQSSGDSPSKSANKSLADSSKEAELNQNLNEDSEFEEVEVTDDENDDIGDKNSSTSKQFENESKSEAPVEFNEDDIAYQLAVMGEEYGLEPDEYGDTADLEDDKEITREDSSALFKDLLNDVGINPYSPWEKIIEEGRLLQDIRYTSLSSMKLRKEIWEEWSRDKIKQIRSTRGQEEKIDPRVSYLTFLEKHATPKLYWPEFKRKYKKEPELRNPAMSDREREKLYRDHISHLKQLK